MPAAQAITLPSARIETCAATHSHRQPGGHVSAGLRPAPAPRLHSAQHTAHVSVDHVRVRYGMFCKKTLTKQAT